MSSAPSQEISTLESHVSGARSQGDIDGAFSAATTEILENGDVLDRLKWIHRISGFGKLSLLGAGISAAQYGILSNAVEVDQQTMPLSAFVILGGTIAATRMAKPFMRQRERNKVKDLTNTFGELGEMFDGDSLELYREYRTTKESRFKSTTQTCIHVAWEPSAEKAKSQDALAESMARLSALAVKNHLTSIIVPTKSLDIPEETMDGLVNNWDRTRWIKTHKGVPVYGLASSDDTMNVFSPHQLHELSERLRLTEPNALDTYTNLMSMLQPRHPAARALNVQPDQRIEAAKRVERSFRRLVEARLHEVSVEPRDYTKGGPTHIKTHDTGRLSLDSRRQKGGAIKWISDEGKATGEERSLLDYYGISLRDLAALPVDFKKYPKPKAIALCEIAIWLAAYDETHPQSPNQLLPPLRSRAHATHRTQPIDAPRGMQQRIADKITLRKPPVDAKEILVSLPHRLKHPSTIWLFGAMSLIAHGTELLDTQATKYVDAHIEAQADDTAIIWGQYDESKKTIRAIKTEGGWIFQAARKTLETGWKAEIASEDAIRPIKDRIAGEPDSGRFSKNLAGVGNVIPGKSKPEWFVESYGNMSSEGYWAISTSHRLTAHPLQWSDNDINDEIFDATETDEQMISLYRALTSLKPVPTPDSLDIEQPLLKVQGSTLYAEIVQLEYGTDKVGIKIPVLQGTQIVAALAAGDLPLSRTTLEDGTTMLLVNADGATVPESIEYWLAPDPNAPLPRATQMVSGIQSNVLKPTLEPWRKYIPSIDNLTPQDRLVKQLAYIRKEFKYSLQPLDTSDSLEDRQRFATDSLEDEEANCNTANTLLNISNPDILNYAQGYQNSDTPNQIKKNARTLSSSEAHAWSVGREGSIFDATPIKGLSDKEREHFKEDYALKYDPNARNKQPSIEDDGIDINPVIFYGLGGLLAGGGIFLGRRRIGKIALRIQNPSETEQLVAHDLVRQAIYAGAPLDRSRYDGAVARTSQAQHSADDTWANFVDYHDQRKTRTYINRALKTATDKDARKALRLGRRLLKQY